VSSGDPSEASRALVRLLRQRLEMGTGELFLDSLSREELLRLAEKVRSGEAVPAGSGTVSTTPRAAGSAQGSGSSRSTRPPTPSGTSGKTDSSERAGNPARSEQAGDAEEQEPGGEGHADGERAVRTGDAGEETIRTFDYDTLRTVALGCRRCGLAEERKQVVFADGSRTARLMVVGEAPGAREDATGLPFVGPAGKLLDLLLAAVNLSREESVYICNVIKCRPPGNRNPLTEEIEACAPYLRRQIELVSPRAILAVGTFAGRLLTGRDSTLGNLRGDVYSYEGVPLLVTYHPAALLRNRRWVRSTWDDLQMLRGVLDGSA